MSNILKLFRLQIDEKFDFFKSKSIVKLLLSIAKGVLLIAVLSLVLYTLAFQLVLIGFAVNVQLLSIILLVTQLIIFVFACGNIINTLYTNKDNELLMSLPVSPNQIFLSKMLVIYIKELLVNAIITIPFAVVMGMFGGFGVWFYFSFIPIILFMPLLPLCLASFISIPLMFVLKFFKKHPLVSVVTIMLIIAGAIYLYVIALGAFAETFNLTNVVKQMETVKNANESIIAFGNRNFLFIGLAEFMVNIAYIPWLLAYIGIGGGLMMFAILLIRPFYFKMAMSNSENDTSLKKERKFIKLNKFTSLLCKEVLTIFRSPGYVFQYFVFALLMPLIVALYDNLLISFAVNQTGTLMVAGAHTLIICIMACLSNIISATAISREGAAFHIVKTAPVNYYTQTAAKIVFNAIFSVGAVIITAICSSFYLSFDIVICSTLVAVFLSLGHMFMSFDMDLKKPVLTWYDTSEISSVSKSTTKSIGWGLGIGMISGLFIVVMSAAEQVWLSWLILILASLAFCVYKAYILIIRIFYQYDKTEM